MKTLREIIAEQDEEYDYYVKSTADIHHPEIFAQVKLALLGFKIRNMTVDSYKPLMKSNDDFPKEPNSPVYIVKVVTALPIVQGEQLIALHTRINAAHLLVHVVGENPHKDIPPVHTGRIHQNDDRNYKAYTQSPNDFNPDPHKVVPDKAQDMAGLPRLSDLMKELETGRKVREKEKRTRQVYEAFMTSHMMLESVLKTPLRKGYYMVEVHGNSQNMAATVDGPFANKADNIPYRDDVFARTVETKIIKTSEAEGRTLLEVSIDGYEPPSIEPSYAPQNYEVQVEDSETGRQYRAIVRENTVEAAREKAIQTIAAQQNLSPSSLTVLGGTPEAN